MPTVSTPTGSNAAAKTGVAIGTDVVNTGVKIGEGLLFADFPVLATPGLRQLIELLIGFVSGYVVRGLNQVVVFSIIDAQVGHEENDFSKALADLKAAQASGDKNAIAQALARFQVAAQNLGHSDGSTPI